jgi:hypothetical protein
VARIAIVAETDSLDGIDAMLATTYLLDCWHLARHPEVPPLYQAGVVYRRERRGDPIDGLESERDEERFLTIPAVRSRGGGDCDDLAPWRAAELTVREGIPSRPWAIEVRPGRVHVVVWRSDGYVEDPARALGMR